jgi:hypothetical protein
MTNNHPLANQIGQNTLDVITMEIYHHFAIQQ